MAAFPKSPVPPAELLETWLPKAFAEAELPDEMRTSDLRLGVELTGKDGGEWVLELEHGELRVRPASRADTAFSYVQSVDDWRGALWHGRGGVVGQATAGLFRPGETPMLGGSSAPGASGMVALPGPAAIEQMRQLDGLVRVVVTGGQGGDWSVGFKLGPGAIPAQPTTTLVVSEADLGAMQRGELNPLEAFMAGRIRVEGDMTLVMQMQAIAMQAAAQAKKA